MDVDTLRDYELQRDQKEFPTFDKFIEYLKHRSAALENITPSNVHNANHVDKPRKQTTTYVTATDRGKDARFAGHIVCAMCNSNHPITQYAKYIAMSVEKKRDFVKANKLCFNCLRTSHMVERCTNFPSGCKKMLEETPQLTSFENQRRSDTTKVASATLTTQTNINDSPPYSK